MTRIFAAMALLAALMAPAWAQTDVRNQLNALQQEPGVRETQEAALRYFKVNSKTVASMRSRAGLKALLPATEVSGGYESADSGEDTVNKEFSQNEAWVIRAAGGTKWNIRGKMTWNLPQLVFNAEELDVASLAGLMEGILKESTRLYFMRRRLQVDMILTPPKDQASLLSKQLRLEELTGLIDAMTGGWFGEVLKRRGQQASVKVPTGLPMDLSTHLPRPRAAGPAPSVVMPARMPVAKGLKGRVNGQAALTAPKALVAPKPAPKTVLRRR